MPYSELKTKENAVNVLYIRDYDMLSQEELAPFDGIATSSPDFYSYVMSAGYAALYLPEFTDPSVYYPAPNNALSYNLLYVGDNERHSVAVAAALDAKLPIEIFGRFWNGNIDEEYIKGEYIHENELASYFSSAKINLVNVTENEARIGIIPARIFDVAASKGFIIAPYNAQIEKVFGDAIPMFKNAEELKELYNKYLKDDAARAEKAEKAYKIAVAEYNVDAFVSIINLVSPKGTVLLVSGRAQGCT